MKLVTEAELHRQFLENMHDVLFIHNNDNILFMNTAGAKLFGVANASEIISKSIWILYPAEIHGIVRSRNQTMKQNHESVPTIEYSVLRLDGTRVSVEVTECLIEYDGNEVFYVMMHDISQRKKTQLCLDMQYAVSHCLINSANITNATRGAIDIICNSMNFGYGKIWALDKKDQVLRYLSSWSDGKDTDKTTEKVYSSVVMNHDDGLPGKVVTTRLPLWIEDLSKESVAYYPKDFKYTTAIVIPIKNEKELVGVMEFVSSNKIVNDDIIMQALQSVGEQIGAFLKHKQFEKDLVYLSKHDPITGLSNRNFFEETLAFEISLAKSKDQQLALLFLDIDSFPTINEGLGHAAGDLLLRSVAVRLINIQTNAQNVARFGPQFAIILDNIQKIDDINNFITKLLSCTEEDFAIQDQNVKIQFNIGVALYSDNGEDVTTLMRSASIALSSAKSVGGGAIQFCTPKLNEHALARIKIENDLYSALENNELFLSYQPIVAIPSLQTIGFESLIRWSKNGRNINPVDFIQIAEKTHLIIPIGKWIIRTACLQCKQWQINKLLPVSVAVNISPVQFKHSGVIDVLQATLQETGLDPSLLKIEITESAIMDNAPRNVNILKTIKEMGIKISIDDFGSGYSSLNYLRHLPIDFLKIDQSFVHNMTNDDNDAAIVKTIIELAHNLNYQVIAEGVETQAQLNFLNNLGCHFIQGYYFSKPLRAEETLSFLKQGKLSI